MMKNVVKRSSKAFRTLIFYLIVSNGTDFKNYLQYNIYIFLQNEKDFN